jgi:hypothetical protein
VLSLEQRFRARGLRVIGVAKTDPDEQARAAAAHAAAEEKMVYPSFLDHDGGWLAQSGIGHIPVFVVVGRDGRLAYRHAGKLLQGTPEYDALTQAIERSLDRPRG